MDQPTPDDINEHEHPQYVTQVKLFICKKPDELEYKINQWLKENTPHPCHDKHITIKCQDKYHVGKIAYSTNKKQLK